MRGFDRDLIRGGHYGQRSCEPHLQAEHMAALAQACEREASSCQLGAVHTRTCRSILAMSVIGNSGKHVLALSFSGFDPGCVKTCTSRECAELFSLSSSPVVAASTFGFLIDGIETKFLPADRTPEFSRSQDPKRNSRTGRLFFGRLPGA